MKHAVHAGTVREKDKESTGTSTNVQGSSERGEQEKQPDQQTRGERKKSKKHSGWKTRKTRNTASLNI